METKWILKLFEQVTAPLREIQDAADEAADAVSEVADNAEAVEEAVRQVRRPMEAATQAAEGLSDSLEDTATEAQRVQRNIETIQQNLSRYRGKLEVETDPEKIRAYRTMIEELEQRLEELDNHPDPEQARNNWGAVALAANQTFEIAEKLVDALDFAGEIANLQNNIQRMTDATGDDLEELTQKVYHIAKVFDEDADEVAIAANAITKQLGGTFTDNLDLIQQGFEKGANLNKEFLDQLKEYGPQFKALGLSGRDAIALMVKEGKDGIFSDKAIDSIKEANLSLREMGQAQVNALHAVGLKVKDLAGKTTFEAVQMISKAMATAPLQAKQMVIADIFKGAGEDAGTQFLQGLASVDMDINNVQSIQQAGASTKGFLADMQSWFATSFHGIASNITVLGSIGAAIAGFLPILTALRESTLVTAAITKIAAAAQWLWNAAFTASPIGWIVTAIAAVAAGIVYAWGHFEKFRQVVFGLWETFKQVFNNILGLFKAVFAPIGEAIAAVREGRWADAGKAILKMNGVSMAQRAISYVADGGLTKGVAEAWDKGKKEGSASFKASQQEEKKDAPSTAGNSYTNGLAGNQGGNTLSGKVMTNQGGASGNGLSISGSGGSKSISMSLTVHNHFGNISSRLDIRKVADEVAGLINDRLRDAAVSLG